MKLFSFRLYKEGLRRTKNIMIALSIVALIWVGISFASNVSYFKETKSPIFTTYDTVTSTASLLPVYMYVMGIAFALSAFSFLNKRNECDFYHALPYSRTQMFISYSLACITWIVTIILVVMLIPAVGSAIVGMEYEWSFFLHAALTTFAGTLLVFAATVFAMSITGTAFSNLIATGLILFLPRFILTLAGILISEKAHIVNVTNLGIFFNPIYNIPVGNIVTVFDMGASMEQMYMSMGAFAYTVVLALLYLTLAALMFCKRKSEMAGNSAPGKVLQTVYRCCVGLVFALVFTAFLIMDEDSITVYAILFALSVVPFFLYELITSRSIKATMKAMPTYGFVIIVCVLFFFAVILSVKAVVNVLPQKDKIASIQLRSNDSILWEDRDNINDWKKSNAKVTDKEAINLAQEALSETIDLVNDDDYGYGYDRAIETVTFNLTNGSSVTRQVYFSNLTEYGTFLNLVEEDASYKAAAEYIPAYEDFSRIYVEGLTKDEIKTLWESYVKEVKATPDISAYSERNYYDAMTEPEYYSKGDYMAFEFRTLIFEDSRYFTDTYFVITGKMPETSALYLGMIAQKKETARNFNEFMNEFTGGTPSEYVNCEISVADREYLFERVTALGFVSADNPDAQLLCNQNFGWVSGMEPDSAKDIFKGAQIADKIDKTTVHISYYSYEGPRPHSFSIYVNLTAEGFDKMLEVQNGLLGIGY